MKPVVGGPEAGDVSVSAAVWYWENTLQKRLLFPLSLHRKVSIPNAKIGKLYNLIWYIVLIGFTFLAVFQRAWDSDFTIRPYMWSKLGVLKPADDGYDGRLYHQNHCKGEYAGRSVYWRGNETYQKYSGFVCKPRCSAQVETILSYQDEGATYSFLNPECMNSFLRTRILSDSKILVTTHMSRTSSNFIPDQSGDAEGSSTQHFWTYSPEKERLYISFGFNVPESGRSLRTGEDSRFRSAQTADADPGFQTFLLNHDGGVFREIDKGKQVSVTVEELLMMSGHEVRWLDTYRPEAGPNKMYSDRDNSNTGPLARLSGGILQLYIRCLDRLVLASGTPFFYGNHVECHMSVELVPIPWLSLKHSFIRNGKVMDVEKNGLTVVTIIDGTFSRNNWTALILYIFAFIVVMEVPRWLLTYFMHHCLGLISKIYKRGCYESMSVETMVSGMLARLLQIPLNFMSLSDTRNVRGSMGISRVQMKKHLDILIKYAGFRLSVTDRSKCLDYLFLMVVKTQLADMYEKGKKVHKREKKAKKKAAKKQAKEERQNTLAQAEKTNAAYSAFSVRQMESLAARLRAMSSLEDRRDFIASLPEAKQAALQHMVVMEQARISARAKDMGEHRQDDKKLKKLRDSSHDHDDDDDLDDAEPASQSENQILSKSQLKMRNAQNVISALEDSFSGISLVEINKALHHGISLGGFYGQCSELERMKLSLFVEYFQRDHRANYLETLIQPYELSPEGITVACRRGRNISNKTQVWVDQDYLTLQKKFVKRHAEQQQNYKRMQMEAEKRKLAALQATDVHETSNDKARKRLLLKFEQSETHEEEAMEHFVSGMHELYFRSATAQTHLDELNRGISLMQQRRSQKEFQQLQTGQTEI